MGYVENMCFKINYIFYKNTLISHQNNAEHQMVEVMLLAPQI